MNPYLAREEKEAFVRLLCLAVQLEQAIDTYAGFNSTDKTFLAELRHARTRLEKATKIRRGALTSDDDKKLIRDVSRVHLMFLATPEAKREHAEMLKLKSVIPMDGGDMNDWYEFVIESTCKVCRRTDYEACVARRILAKYGVWPVDPGAAGKCQYSYQDGVANDMPDFASDMASDVNECELVVNKADPADRSPELPAGLLPVMLGLAEGKALEMAIPEELAASLLDELRDHNRHGRGICAAHAGTDLVCVDMREVVAVIVKGVEEWSAEHQSNGNSTGMISKLPYTDEKELYHVECRCGSEYSCSMNAGRPIARCRDCHSSVFADRSIGAIEVVGGEATLMTNRYWVEMGA